MWMVRSYSIEIISPSREGNIWIAYSLFLSLPCPTLATTQLSFPSSLNYYILSQLIASKGGVARA